MPRHNPRCSCRWRISHWSRGSYDSCEYCFRVSSVFLFGKELFSNESFYFSAWPFYLLRFGCGGWRGVRWVHRGEGASTDEGGIWTLRLLRHSSRLSHRPPPVPHLALPLIPPCSFLWISDENKTVFSLRRISRLITNTLRWSLFWSIF